MIDMRQIEAGRGAAMPMLRHADTHLFLYLVDGMVKVALDGVDHSLSSGDAVNIPAGTAYATQVLSGTARWVASSAGGNGASLWEKAGRSTSEFSFPLEADSDDAERLRGLSGVDLALV